ncbi:Hypothetical predicted protein [Paramuricea clavata]|uniref:Uncharacterized protein n=1 Tax=Paramuricea clavata TaxID=317549 RepID=A0A7D9EXF5_PARCT|nr:Hypothetical predicted protein [Paramuricea clavata]
MSNDGDQIYIDYAQGRPYMECQNVTQSACSIELTKSVSFHGINGKAEIQCTKSCKFFKIMSSSFYTTKIKFLDLVISSSETVAELDVGARSKLVFQNALIRETFHGIYSKRSTDCSILITNSRFEHNFNWGIYLRCQNLTMQIKSSTFKSSPLFITNIGNKPTLWQKTELFFRSTVFDFQNTPRCVDMVAIKPFAAILNVTIIESRFKNHIAICRPKDHISTLHICDSYSKVRNITFIFLSNLVIENNCNNWATLPLTVVYFSYTKVKVMIRDSIFRNNSAALHLRVLVSHSPTTLTLFIENNTFVDNTYEQFSTPNGAAAIYFATGISRVSSCRFLDNKAGENPYTGVVTISEKARVTFYNSYFENRQTKVPSNQLFASENQPLYFVGENTFNLVALNEGQSVFIRIPTGTGSGMIIKKNFKILCPQGYKLNPQRQCMVIKTGILCYYVNVRCEQCPTKTYTLERGELTFNKSNDIQCRQCPRGGDCERGVVTAKPNFWGYKTRVNVVFVQCPAGYCCETKDCPFNDSCHGNRSDTLCGQCPEGMSESLFTTQCISNMECTLNYFFVLGTIGLLVLYLVFFLYHKEIKLSCCSQGSHTSFGGFLSLGSSLYSLFGKQIVSNLKKL